jgi:hypothetical protein
MEWPRYITLHRNRLVFDKRHTWEDGRRERIRLRVPDEMQTPRKAAVFQRSMLELLSRGIDPRKEQTQTRPEAKRREVPTFSKFSAFFIDTYATNNNRASTVREKRRALGRGLLDELGALRLDAIGAREIEAFKARRKRDGVGGKSINEELAILAKLLDFANEVGDLPSPPPKIRRLKVKKPTFDFLDFEEGERLFAAASNAPDPWCAMIPIAMLTGLRLGDFAGCSGTTSISSRRASTCSARPTTKASSGRRRTTGTGTSTCRSGRSR